MCSKLSGQAVCGVVSRQPLLRNRFRGACRPTGVARPDQHQHDPTALGDSRRSSLEMLMILLTKWRDNSAGLRRCQGQLFRGQEIAFLISSTSNEFAWLKGRPGQAARRRDIGVLTIGSGTAVGIGPSAGTGRRCPLVVSVGWPFTTRGILGGEYVSRCLGPSAEAPVPASCCTASLLNAHPRDLSSSAGKRRNVRSSRSSERRQVPEGNAI